MQRQEEAEVTAIADKTGDEIARAARIASLMFDGRALSDDELDDLCDAVLSQDDAPKAQSDKKTSR